MSDKAQPGELWDTISYKNYDGKLYFYYRDLTGRVGSEEITTSPEQVLILEDLFYQQNKFYKHPYKVLYKNKIVIVSSTYLLGKTKL